MWCLLAAPLLIGCDMEKLDAFTLNLLGNDEVLALDQDPLGKEATCVWTNKDVRLYVKPLADGSRGAGFFNLSKQPVTLDFTQFEAIGLSGVLQVRDLWRQQDQPDTTPGAGPLTVTIPAHGVVLYKFTAK